jgi:hypothetical protein
MEEKAEDRMWIDGMMRFGPDHRTFISLQLLDLTPYVSLT